MTSWVRNSPLRVSLGRRRSASLQDVDPAAAFHSFIKHWQQTCDIFERTQLRGQVRLHQGHIVYFDLYLWYELIFYRSHTFTFLPHVLRLSVIWSASHAKPGRLYQ